MSSFLKELKNPKTGKTQVAYCIDDFYSSHIYGYGFRKDGKDANWDIEEKMNFKTDCDFYKQEELNK